MQKRPPFFWITWLTPLLAGEDSCEAKIWTKAHHSDVPKFTRPQLTALYPGNAQFGDQDWDSAHTALLNDLREEYRPRSRTVLTERPWKIQGKSATVSGKIDLVTLGPNRVIDAKTGKQKNSHVLQVRAYLLAIKLGAVPGIRGDFKGVLRYPDQTIEVAEDPNFANHFYSLIKRLAGEAPDYVPSFNECRFCDLANCESRVTEEVVFQTAEF